ncbi:hypothetical protein VTO42DRAFT_7406 [Malbranchea cinnamomea]
MTSSPSLLKQFTTFTNSADGLENLLRLLQYVCQVVEALSISPVDAEPWVIAWKNIALGRRYFRFFKFIDCFEHAWAIFPGRDHDTSIVNHGGYVASTLEACMWTNFGCYLLLEALTILEALGVWVTDWSRKTLVESYKFWFYSLFFSILRSIWQLFWLSVNRTNKGPAAAVVPSDTEVKTQDERPIKLERQEDRVLDVQVITPDATRSQCGYELMTDLVVSSCDILIPGSSVGWIEVSPLIVGSAGILSTLLLGRRKWLVAQKQH